MIQKTVVIGFAALLFMQLNAANEAVATVEIEWVTVGDPGNAPHNVTMVDGTTGYGTVDYTFRIGKYEVTNAQYAEFLNAVAKSDPKQLYSTSMSTLIQGGITRLGANGNYVYSVKPNMDDKPVNLLTWFSAARFCNWLHNGQPVGPQGPATTEDGAYTFGVPNPNATHLDHDAEILSARNPGALYFIPTEHEFHKAAFYEPGAVTVDGDEYWYYGNRSDQNPPPFALADAVGNVSNPSPLTLVHSRNTNWNGSGIQGNVVTVGSAGSTSYYGAADMSGSVFEWVEQDPTKPDPFGAGLYAIRGGSYFSGYGHMRSTERNNGPKIGDGDSDGIDFLIWQREYGGNGPMTADFNGDLSVDNADLPIWEAAYGVTAAADADFNVDEGHVHNFLHKANGFRVAAAPLPPMAAVPEPSAIALGLLSIVVAEVLPRRLSRRSA